MKSKPLFLLGLFVCFSLTTMATYGQVMFNNGRNPDRIVRYCPVNPSETERKSMEADFHFRRSALGSMAAAADRCAGHRTACVDRCARPTCL